MAFLVSLFASIMSLIRDPFIFHVLESPTRNFVPRKREIGKGGKTKNWGPAGDRTRDLAQTY